MSLKLILTPLEHTRFADLTDPYSLFNQVALYEDNLPDILSADIVIVGVPDTRGSKVPYDATEVLYQIRRKLYGFKISRIDFRIADLGNVANGPTLQDTYERLALIQRNVLESGKVLVILGATHDLTLGQYAGCTENRKVILTTIDYTLDLNSNNELGNNTFFIAKILAKLRGNLLKWMPLAYQSHLVQNSHLKVLDSMFFPSLSLGNLRKNIFKSEPYIRNADILSIDLQALAWPYHTLQNNPFGLSADELLQLLWFAGFSEKCQSIGFYELHSPKNQEVLSTLVATAIWYFLEAYYHAGNAGGPYFQNLKKVVVQHEAFPNEIIFLHNEAGDKFWIEHEYEDELLYIACTEQDYVNATKGIEPEILIYFHA